MASLTALRLLGAVAPAAAPGGDGALVPLELDVSSAASREAAPAKLRALGVRAVHTLVNNAGVYVDGWTQEAFDACVSVNFTGAARRKRRERRAAV